MVKGYFIPVFISVIVFANIFTVKFWARLGIDRSYELSKNFVYPFMIALLILSLADWEYAIF